ncbi:hypothetical protein L6452_27091 [Arctium lappa]|uniref:Uncharacterized protein n=1 Tax=Arctium lappa TaxID=4217 RepID=A0ACB8ZV96_ARCLA|nr:hypothetical protein L6452_27091 [Arctium lappa]
MNTYLLRGAKLCSLDKHLALGYVTTVTIDIGFLVEAQSEEDLPERLFGAVRICQMEMSSATFVDMAMNNSVAPTPPPTSHSNRVQASDLHDIVFNIHK